MGGGKRRLSIAGRWLPVIGVIRRAVYVGSVIHWTVSQRPALQEFYKTGNVESTRNRDGFLRALKDIGKGEAMELASAAGTAARTGNQVEIVRPDAVLDQRPPVQPQWQRSVFLVLVLAGEPSNVAREEKGI
jgi:hypothetical protein